MFAFTKHHRLKVDVGGSMIVSDVKAGIVIESPINGEDATLFATDRDIIINRMRCVLRGTSTPSVTWTIRFGSDRTATGTEVVTGGTTTTSVTTGDTIIIFNNPAISSGDWVWLETTALSGTVYELCVTLFF